VIPACEHFGGQARELIGKALELQSKLGRFRHHLRLRGRRGGRGEAACGDDRRDPRLGAQNPFVMAGARIHDYQPHAHWKQDIDILVGGARQGARLHHAGPSRLQRRKWAEMIAYIQDVSKKNRLQREVPVHVLIETHGALHERGPSRSFPPCRCSTFGLMDFVSGFHGAVNSANMRSPGQFEHPLIARAKTEVATAALAHGVVPRGTTSRST